jgi:hypothetical protein
MTRRFTVAFLTVLWTAIVCSQLDAQVGVGPGFGPLPVPSWGCDEDVPPVTGLIYNEWMRIGGPLSDIGCPLGSFVLEGPDGRGYQQFHHGQIAVSPSVWGRGIVAAYQTSGDGPGFGSIVVDWTVDWDQAPLRTQPQSGGPCCNYDEFLVRWDFNGTHYDNAKYSNGDDVCKRNGASGDGDQCNVIADMMHNQTILLNYQNDTHLRNMGTFTLGPPDHAMVFTRSLLRDVTSRQGLSVVVSRDGCIRSRSITGSMPPRRTNFPSI